MTFLVKIVDYVACMQLSRIMQLVYIIIQYAKNKIGILESTYHKTLTFRTKILYKWGVQKYAFAYKSES